MHLELTRGVTTHGDLNIVTCNGQAHVRTKSRFG